MIRRFLARARRAIEFAYHPTDLVIGEVVARAESDREHFRFHHGRYPELPGDYQHAMRHWFYLHAHLERRFVALTFAQVCQYRYLYQREYFREH